MSNPPFHHTLRIKEDLCQGCTHCMKICPTEAIRIRGGKAHVDFQICIDCGQCMSVCPHNAIVIEQDDFQQIFSFNSRVAIVPTLMIGQFEEDVSESDIIEALHHIGFTHVYWAEFGVDILKTLGSKISVYADTYPVISSYCPAVVRLIQIRYPTLLPNVNLVRTPAQITALYSRKLLESQNIPSADIGIFYITPCAAKYAQIKTLGSDTSGLIQGGLNLDYVFNLIQAHLTNKPKKGGKKFPLPVITEEAFLWSLTKGESGMSGGRTLSVDEVHNVIEFLELVEDERQENLDFLELRVCDTGCTGGILTARNRFLATERIKHHASTLPKKLPSSTIEEIESLSEDLIYDLKVERLGSRNSLQLDSDMTVAIEKLKRIENITQALPGIDCGLCGSPTCRALAEDIVRSKASIRRCVVLKIKNPHGLNNLARIWGDLLIKESSPPLRQEE